MVALLPHRSQHLTLSHDPLQPGKLQLVNGLTGEVQPQKQLGKLHYSENGMAYISMEGAAATWVKFQTKVWQQATGRAYMNVDGKALWLDSMDSAECRYGPVPLPGEDHPARLVLHKVPVPVEGTLLFWQLREVQDLLHLPLMMSLSLSE